MPNDRMKWRLPEHLTVIHADGRQVRIEVSQDGNTLVGTAHEGRGADLAEMTGALSGSVEGDTISLTIYWPDKSTAELNGLVNGDGSVGGTTVGQPDGDRSGNWHSEPALTPWN